MKKKKNPNPNYEFEILEYSPGLITGLKLNLQGLEVHI